MTRKVTRKEIEQPDSFQRTVDKISAYFSKNKAKIYMASGVIVLIFILSAGWYLYRMNYNSNAQKLYSKAYVLGMNNAMQGIPPDQNILKLYQDVLTQYPGSKAAMMSYYQLGNMYYNIGDIEASIKAYAEFIKEAPEGSDLKVMAYNSLGYCYETKRDFKNALEAYEKVSASKTGGSFEGIAYRNIGRIYEEMKNGEKALENYQKALGKTTDPTVENFLKRKISSIN